MALANVALTNTFDEWRSRTNQIIIALDQNDTTTALAYAKANSANLLAYNTGIGANAFAAATIAGANSYLIATIAGANTAVGAGANAFAAATVAGANAYMIAVQNGSNTAIGAGANAFAAATIAGANSYLLATIAGANSYMTATVSGANSYMTATVAGANTAVGAGANNYLLAVIAGANTAVGTGANNYQIAIQNGANTAVGAGANSWANTKVSSVTGTTNQITVSGTTSVTLSTPQSIGTASSVQFGSFGVGTAASGTTGEIRATNNITAYYSDMRLKEQIVVIADAMNKLKQISGVYYKPNDVARSHGYNDDSEHVGVLAQDVQKVLPHAVKGAPFDTIFVNEKEVSVSGKNYLTVQYEKIIPLLIEAVKELNKKTEEQQELINKLLKDREV